MAVQEHLDKLKEGVEAWNAWRHDSPNVVPDLSGFEFGGMDVSGVDFRQADLRGAELSSVAGLLPASLAGADLTRAELPAELKEFPALEHVAEVSRHARVNFLAVVASCVFCWLTITQTSDGALIANRGQLTLPVINTEVPVTGFFLFAPAILLALYVYLQLYLQRMWDGLSRLPAVFPDGARLDQKAFPWLLSGLISVYIPRLRKGSPPFAWLQVILSVVAAWLLVPATIAWFWLRYLLVTDELGIAPHVVLLSLAIAFGLLSYRRAHASLRGTQEQSRGPIFAEWPPAARLSAPLVVLFVSLGVAVGATYGLWYSAHLWHLDFVGEEVRNEAELKLYEESEDKLKLLDLRNVNFRYAEGREATLVKVDLSGADLSNSEFHAADLRGVILRDAILTGAKFVDARLDGALFAGSRLIGAEFTRAKGLSAAMFANACGNAAGLPSVISLKPCEPSSTQVASAETKIPSPAKGDRQQVAVGDFDKRPGDLFQDCDSCPEMVVVPRGEFVMGSPENEEGRFANEGPQHGVKIAVIFAVGRFEVTFEEWDACVTDGGCGSYRPDDEDWGRGKRPAVNVSWRDAQAFVTWMNSKVEGTPYHLPSETEWEYAARAGAETAFWWGEKADHEYANYGQDECCGGLAEGRDEWEFTAPVGSFPANEFQLHDMQGNTWEWTEDCWNDSYSGAPVDGTSWEKGDCESRVLRGGSWTDRPRLLRSASRVWNKPGNRSPYVGFRVARTLTP